MSFPVKQLLTVRRTHVGHVRIVCSLASEKTDTRWTAYGNCAIMLLVKYALLSQVFPRQRHVVHRAKVEILVISDDEDKIRLAMSSARGRNSRTG